MRSLAFGKPRPVLHRGRDAGRRLCGRWNRAGCRPVLLPACPRLLPQRHGLGHVRRRCFGAITGAAVAGRKDRGAGALIGAGVGAVTGNLLGRSKDAADERRAAFGAAAVGQMNQQAAAMAVTNYDLLQMTRAGLSEDVIISTMRSRGARIDLSPQSLIALKQQGVSDRVVMAAQDMSGGGLCDARARGRPSRRQRSAAAAGRYRRAGLSAVSLLPLPSALLPPSSPSPAHVHPLRVLS